MLVVIESQVIGHVRLVQYFQHDMLVYCFKIMVHSDFDPYCRYL